MMGMLILMVTVAIGAKAQSSYTTTFEQGRMEVKITLVSPKIVHVQAYAKGHLPAALPIQIVKNQPATTDRFRQHTVNDSNGATSIQLAGSQLSVVVPQADSANSGGFVIKDSRGQVLVDARNGLSSNRQTVLTSFSLAADEEIFGGGLQFHSLAQRGKTKMLKVNADPRDDLGNSHAVTPFFLSTRGYGLFVNTISYSYFDFGHTDANRLAFHTDDTYSDFYLFTGTSFHDLISQYTQLTGRMPMPPKWGLGFWYRMKSDWKADKATEIAAQFRAHAIGCDVLGLEPAWQTHAYSCSYIWNHAQFPDPPGFVKAMRDSNFHLNLWEHAYVHPSSPIHSELLEKRLVGDKEVWGGLVPDFTLPETEHVFATLHQKEHIALGVDGYKLDECDGSDFTGGWFFPDNAKFPSGLSGAQMHNVFGFLYQKAFHEMFDTMDKRTYFLCRGNYAGGQGYPTVVYSDWYDFKDYVRAACNSGFSGLLWCPEVRQTASSEEFVRRFQTLFFSPLAMINAWADGVTPWEKGAEVEAVFRKYDSLRSQLTPYLYNSFRVMNKTGLPVVRALAVDWPHDRATYSIDDEFMYGDSLLVAPVFEGKRRSVYLPAGNWTNWWTGDQYKGEQRIDVDAPLDTIPLFVRSGAVIAMQPPMHFSGEIKDFPLELSIYPAAAETKTTLYDDDGETLAYRNGTWTETDVSCVRHNESILVKISAARDKSNIKTSWRGYQLSVHGVKSLPERVSVRGKNVSIIANSDAAAPCSYDAERQMLRVSISDGAAATIRIESKATPE